METLRLEGDPPITKWEVFKMFINSYVYLIGYEENQWTHLDYFQHKKGQTVQEYTT
jgi:hypothetical protein